ncbi:MAG: M48 family metallopeptidase [Bacilli bacterium]
MINKKKIIEYEIDNTKYPVEITYKAKKLIHYRFRNNTFYVTCPPFVLNSTIKKGLDKYASKLIETVNKNAGEGEDFIYLFGDKIQLSFPGKIKFSTGEEIVFSTKEELDKKLKTFFLSVMKKRVLMYEALMKIKPPYKVKIRKMETRNGSNSKATNTLCFNLKLIHYDYEIIDSVIIHELAHFFYFDHSKNFYNVVYKYCPNYKTLHNLLRKKIYHYDQKDR